MKYEYAAEINVDKELLNKLGAIGWELIAVVSVSTAPFNGTDKMFYFKRLIK